ncbi:NAD-dependent epimerase/dehydratase family protein [Micromonospora maritima]|uniref:NAD-dependent epimerase/dehydratase family protein n=1 Tax=Micromonospora maritima TaxID=986711 RepID=UPI0037BA7C4C
MTTVLLLGASGFLGGHVRQALAPFATLHCPTRAELDLVRCDVAELAALLRTVRPSTVVNCGGRLSGDGAELVLANTAGTAKLVEAIGAVAPGTRLVRVGSAAEYGSVPHGHAACEDDPAVPVSEYGVSQLAATRLVELAGAAGRVDGVVLRVFNPIGPGLPAETVLGRAAALLGAARATAATGISMGPLTAYRDFVDVRDVASAVVAAVRAPVLPERVYNVASGSAVPTRDAVRLLAETAGFTGEIREDLPAPGRSAAVGWMCGDVRRAGRLLGWAPAYDLVDSVKAVWSSRADGTTRPNL